MPYIVITQMGVFLVALALLCAVLNILLIYYVLKLAIRNAIRESGIVEALQRSHWMDPALDLDQGRKRR